MSKLASVRLQDAPRGLPRAQARVGARAASAARAASPSGAASGASAGAVDFLRLYRADPMERVQLVKAGVAAEVVESIARRMAISKERFVRTLGLAPATVGRKARARQPLSADESSRVLGIARLVGQVQAMVEESGEPTGFDAAHWVAQWLEQPLPALGGRRPAELMDTPDGQALIANLMARMQTGAHA